MSKCSKQSARRARTKDAVAFFAAIVLGLGCMAGAGADAKAADAAEGNGTTATHAAEGDGATATHAAEGDGGDANGSSYPTCVVCV